jgi:large subunit ribosomal protein L13
MTAVHKLTKRDLNKTVHVHPHEMNKDRKRYIVDASGQTLGRLAVEIAKKLHGKHKPNHSQFWDNGDYVVVINADKISTTGYKLESKKYFRYSGYKGNVKSRTLKEMYAEKPQDILMFAVRGMLPKNKLRANKMKRLKLFVGADHSYTDLPLTPLLDA